MLLVGCGTAHGGGRIVSEPLGRVGTHNAVCKLLGRLAQHGNRSILANQLI
jgi:formate dehydrogenase assembly factor FdhD